MSLYNRDKQTEEIVSTWTEKHLFSTDEFSGEYIRNTDAALQKSGVDFRLKSNDIFNDDKYHNVDEKSATSYIRTNLNKPNIPTFAFELDYNNRKDNVRN